MDALTPNGKKTITIIYIPESKVVKLVLEAVQEKDLPGFKKPKQLLPADATVRNPIS